MSHEFKPVVLLGPLISDGDRRALREHAKRASTVYMNTALDAGKIEASTAALIFDLCASELTCIRQCLELDELFRRAT